MIYYLYVYISVVMRRRYIFDGTRHQTYQLESLRLLTEQIIVILEALDSVDSH